MADKIAGVEASAIGLLKQAIQMDSEKKFTEAIVCYQEGIQLLLTVLKGMMIQIIHYFLLSHMSQYCFGFYMYVVDRVLARI